MQYIGLAFFDAKTGSTESEEAPEAKRTITFGNKLQKFAYDFGFFLLVVICQALAFLVGIYYNYSVLYLMKTDGSHFIYKSSFVRRIRAAFLELLCLRTGWNF